MKRVGIGLVVVLLVLVGLYLGMTETGEVVVLETSGASGVQKTRVWVVDDAGAQWLRTGNPKNSWLARIRANGDVAVTRHGERREYHAVPVEDDATRERINDLELAKYGLSEQLLRLFFLKPAHTTPIRLDPR